VHILVIHQQCQTPHKICQTY